MSISILIPTKDQAEFLALSIESVLQQSRPADEIIVSDNYSTDRTEHVLQGFRNRVKVISPPAPLSLFNHFNFIATYAKSEWIAFLGSDDVAKPKYAETLLRGADGTEDAVLIRAAYEAVDGRGAIGAQHRIRTVRHIERWPNTLSEQLEGPRVNLNSCAIRRSAFQAVGGFSTRMNLYADWVLYLILAKLGAFVYEPSIITEKRLDYRPGKDRERALDELEDEYLIATEILPTVSDSLGSHYTRKVQRAQRRRLKRRVAHAREVLDGDSLRASEHLVHEWASAIGCPEVASAFERGARIRQPSEFASALRTARAFIRREIPVWQRNRRR